MIGKRSNGLLPALVLALGMSACLLPPPDAVVVQSAPPPVRVEVYDVAPGPGFFWIAGHWAWGGAEYVWVSGRWARPPRGYHRWESGRRQRHGHNWRWKEGHWRR